MTVAQGTSTADLSQIEAKLRQRARHHFWMALGQVFVGLAATVVLPIVLFGIVPSLSGRMFWIIMAILIPAMYISEWWTRGDYYLEQARYMRATHWYSGTYTVRSWTDLQARAFAVYWEILLFAPRQVFEGWTWLRCVLIAREADLQRTAEIVRALQARSESMAIKDLQKAHETPLGFDHAMVHLLVHEWVGVGETNRGQVWLTTESRETLRAG